MTVYLVGSPSRLSPRAGRKAAYFDLEKDPAVFTDVADHPRYVPSLKALRISRASPPAFSPIFIRAAIATTRSVTRSICLQRVEFGTATALSAARRDEMRVHRVGLPWQSSNCTFRDSRAVRSTEANDE